MIFVTAFEGRAGLDNFADPSRPQGCGGLFRPSVAQLISECDPRGADTDGLVRFAHEINPRVRNRLSRVLEARNHTLQPGSGFHGNFLHRQVSFEGTQHFHRVHRGDD